MPNTNEQLDRSTNRWMVAGIVLMVVGLLAFPLYRIYEPTARAQAAEETQANLASAGARLWTSTCASCHGANGWGVDAPALNSIQFLTIASDAQIFSLVSSGVPGTDMAAYSQQFGGPLTRQQIASLTACIRWWEETSPDRPDWREMMTAPAEEEGDGHAHDEAPEAHGDEETIEGPVPCGPGYDPEDFPASVEPVDESEPHIDEVPHGDEEPTVDESEPHIDEVPHGDEEPTVDESEPHIDEVPHGDEVPCEEPTVDESEPHIDEVPHGDEVPCEEPTVDESEPHVDEVPHG